MRAEWCGRDRLWLALLAGWEAVDPGAGDGVEGLGVELVLAMSAFAGDGHEFGVGEHTEVTAGGGPGAVEAVGELA